MQSSVFALTIPISSIIINGTLISVCILLFFNLYFLFFLSTRYGLISLGNTFSIHKEKNECTVCPHILSADIHVDHRTNGGFPISLQNAMISFISVDFPVPALPVRKQQSSVSSSDFKKYKASALSFRLSKSSLYISLYSSAKSLIWSIYKSGKDKKKCINEHVRFQSIYLLYVVNLIFDK